jgi:hypothetical protein
VSRAWLAAVLGLALVLAPAATGAQAVASRELAAEARRLLQELARLRGVPSGGVPPRVVIRARQDRRRFVAGELARKYAPARLEAERRALVAWGLVPAGFDLATFLTDLVTEQAAAYYDPIGKVMVLANWLGSVEQREALAHELVHLLQDRQIELDRFLSGTPGQSDAALARQALIEGEAVALSLDRTLRARGEDLGALPDVEALQQAILRSAAGPVLARGPRFIRLLLTFPYARGVGFVHQFRRRHPWRDFSRLYDDPPRSTTQILHPERYFDRREDPMRVALPDLGPVLGPGARLVVEDTAGELAVAGILGEFLGEAASADGWRGDRYALWDEPGGAAVLVSRSAWETEPAAEAFADAYGRLLAIKHALGPPSERAPPATRWQAGDRAFLVERSGREVLLLERAPASSLDELRRVIWLRRG